LKQPWASVPGMPHAIPPSQLLMCGAVMGVLPALFGFIVGL
jgi:hypothetical protein